MEQESFEDEKIAKIMNENFVNIKVYINFTYIYSMTLRFFKGGQRRTSRYR